MRTLFPIVALAGLIGTIFAVIHLMHFVRSMERIEFPFQAKTLVEFSNAGRKLLLIKGPQFFIKPVFYGLSLERLQFRLINMNTGAEIPVKISLWRTKISGFSEAETEIRHFTVPKAGRYQLEIISNVAKIKDPEELRLVVRESRKLALTTRIVFLVLSAITFIFGTVLSMQQRFD